MNTTQQADRNASRARRATAVSRIEALGVEYAVQRVPPLKVIGIARRLSAFANSALASAAAASRAQRVRAKARQKAIEEAAAAGTEAEEETKLEAQAFIADLFSPVLDAFARMPEDDQTYIVEACLRCVNDPSNRAHPTLWDDAAGSPVMILSAGDVLAITGEVLKIILPELWEELQQVMGSIAASFVGGADTSAAA